MSAGVVAEELLVESIEAEESLFSTATLFAGFAALLGAEAPGVGRRVAPAHGVTLAWSGMQAVM